MTVRDRTTMMMFLGTLHPGNITSCCYSSKRSCIGSVSTNYQRRSTIRLLGSRDWYVDCRGVGRRMFHLSGGRLDQHGVGIRLFDSRRFPSVSPFTLEASNGNAALENSIVIPMSYAQILGLRGREIWLDPLITAAHDDLFSLEIDGSYSSVARLGKEKILYAAREGLRSVRGRVSLIHPDTRLEPALLPGALALLEQTGEYDLVIQLAEHAERINPRELHPSPSKTTLREFQRDVSLAKALAHCGLAKRALEDEQVALGCARMDEALCILRDASLPGESSLATDLQTNISTALNDLKEDAVLDYLRQPLELAEVSLRNQALKVLKDMLKESKSGSKSKTKEISADYVSQALAALTGEEITRVFDWDRLARDSSARAQLSWWRPGILPKVGLAHLVAGFVCRKPILIVTASHLLAAGRSEGDVSIPMAICEVLLGKPNDALDILKEDEHLGLSLRGKAGLLSKGGPKIHSNALHTLPPFPDRDDVMEYIRIASLNSEDENDLLPGLCLFTEQWLSRIAFPQIRDTKEATPSASLSEYFDDSRTSAYLDSQENPSIFSVIGEKLSNFTMGLRGRLLGSEGVSFMQSFVRVAAMALTLGIVASGIIWIRQQNIVQSNKNSTRSSVETSKPKKASDIKTYDAKMNTLTRDVAKQLIKDWLVSNIPFMYQNEVSMRYYHRLFPFLLNNSIYFNF